MPDDWAETLITPPCPNCWSSLVEFDSTRSAWHCTECDGAWEASEHDDDDDDDFLLEFAEKCPTCSWPEITRNPIADEECRCDRCGAEWQDRI